jgi:CO dehydrogenase/acetyl-CoA synthase epsilon subunit
MNYLNPYKRNLYRIIIKTNNKVESFKRLNKKNIVAIVATGGTITDIVDNGIKYRVHTFKSSGNFEVLSGNAEVEDLILLVVEYLELVNHMKIEYLYLILLNL